MAEIRTPDAARLRCPAYLCALEPAAQGARYHGVPAPSPRLQSCLQEHDCTTPKRIIDRKGINRHTVGDIFGLRSARARLLLVGAASYPPT